MQPEDRRASSIYSARIVQVRTWRDALGDSVFDVLLWALPMPSGEPKFRVVVGGPDGKSVGVREAYRLRTAQSELQDVQKILDKTTPEEARELLQLES